MLQYKADKLSVVEHVFSRRVIKRSERIRRTNVEDCIVKGRNILDVEFSVTRL